MSVAVKKDYIPLLKQLDIRKDEIAHDLSKYYQLIANNPVKSDYARKAWGGVEAYVDALYWIRFVLKLNNQEMDELVGTLNFHKHYKPLGWYSNSYNFDECLYANEAERRTLAELIRGFNYNDAVYNSVDYINATERRTMKALEGRARKRYNVSDVEELSRVMYYFIHVKELSTTEVAAIYGVTYYTIIRLLRVLGMELSRKEARKRIEEKGRGNHQLQHVVARQQMTKKAIENGINGNNLENICRSMIDSTLSQYLDTKRYLYLVGISTYSILLTKEIDIPIMVESRDCNERYKFAVEIDGDVWHEKPRNLKRDQEKDEVLLGSDWKLIRVIFKSKIRSREKRVEEFKKLVSNICGVISESIANKQVDNSIAYIEGF